MNLYGYNCVFGKVFEDSFYTFNKTRKCLNYYRYNLSKFVEIGTGKSVSKARIDAENVSKSRFWNGNQYIMVDNEPGELVSISDNKSVRKVYNFDKVTRELIESDVEHYNFSTQAEVNNYWHDVFYTDEFVFDEPKAKNLKGCKVCGKPFKLKKGKNNRQKLCRGHSAMRKTHNNRVTTIRRDNKFEYLEEIAEAVLPSNSGYTPTQEVVVTDDFGRTFSVEEEIDVEANNAGSYGMDYDIHNTSVDDSISDDSATEWDDPSLDYVLDEDNDADYEPEPEEEGYFDVWGGEQTSVDDYNLDNNLNNHMSKY